MSSYQYYDFYSIDRPLSKQEIKTISGYSSRVEPTARRATFEYSYSDFRYNEEDVLNDHFDMMLYVSSWGQRRVMMKIPTDLIPFKTLQLYDIDASDEYTQELAITRRGKNVLIDFNASQDEGEWIEGQGLLDQMLQLRAQILKGDYRVLYIAWLHLIFQAPDVEESLLELPPVPANLARQDHTLDSFIDFWDIDRDLIQAAAEESESEESISDEQLKAQLQHLPTSEKDDYLILLLADEARAKHALHKRLSELVQGPKDEDEDLRRSLEEIQEAVARQRQLRIKKEQEVSARALTKRMDKISAKQASTWLEIEQSAELKTAKGYERAVDLLKDLKDYAQYAGKMDSFEIGLDRIIERYGKSVALRNRLKKKELWPSD